MKKRKKRRPWLSRQLRRRPRPVWVLILCDALLLGLGLVTFALFHHVLPRHEQSVGIVTTRESLMAARSQADEAPRATDAPAMEAATIAPAAPEGAAGSAEAAEPAPTETPDPDAPKRSVHTTENIGWFGNRFPDKFTDGEVIITDDSYKSSHVNITLQRHKKPGLAFYVADIYIKDIISLKTVFAEDTFSRGLRESVVSMNKRVGGIIAINGDFYGCRADGFVMRNGELYRKDTRTKRDVGVLYWDGTMETFSPSKFDIDDAIAKGACQIWNFGPRLLDENGEAMTKFNSDVWGLNPRTALGYYEPGHYCFVVVDGRTDKSKGMELKDLSKLMHSLGCVRAYNMDGGNTSVMVVGGKAVNNQSGKGRITSDAIVIVDN